MSQRSFNLQYESRILEKGWFRRREQSDGLWRKGKPKTLAVLFGMRDSRPNIVTDTVMEGFGVFWAVGNLQTQFWWK